MRNVAVQLTALAAVLAIGIVGCAEDEEFPECPFDPCLFAQCSEEAESAEGTSIDYSCSVRHSQCEAGWCMIAAGSRPFCTATCDPTQGSADCPENSECQEYLGATTEREPLYFCVPDEGVVPLPGLLPCGSDCPGECRAEVSRDNAGAVTGTRSYCVLRGQPVPAHYPGVCDSLD